MAGQDVDNLVDGGIEALRRREAELERREAALHDVLDVSLDCIKVIDLDGNLAYVNKAGSEALGVPAKPEAPIPWLPLLPEEAREDGKQALSRASAGAPARFAGRRVSDDGQLRHWDNMLTPMLDPDGRVASILCVSRDTTDEQDAIERRRENEERLEIAARVGGLGVWDYDIRNDRLHCDESWYRIMGRDPSRPIRSIGEFRPFVHPDDVDKATEVPATAAALAAAQRDYAIEFRIVRPGGEVRWIRSLAWLQLEDGVPARAVGFVSDVTDALRGELALRDANRALESERMSLARKLLEDPLTGIANRRHLDSELAYHCLRADESGEPLCIGMVDIDRFKQFNDRYGHIAGDDALRKIARALQSVARQSDVVARFGGEEFSFVLPGTRDPGPFLGRFAAAVAALAIPHADSPTGRLTVSCGAIVATGGNLAPERLLRLGDEALYDAKQAGRDRHVVRTVES